MNEAKMVPVMLDKETREIVEAKKGDRGVSSYIRNLIKRQLDPAEDAEAIMLRRELQEARSQIAAFERKEKAVSKEKAEAMAYIAKGLELYKSEDSRRVDDPETCRRWIEARCKGSGISTSEFLSYQVGL
jgi:predicted CopG family antitoxin